MSGRAQYRSMRSGDRLTISSVLIREMKLSAQ